MIVAPTQHLPGGARVRENPARLLPPARRNTLLGAPAPRAAVLGALPRNARAHVDCHAEQDVDQPLTRHPSPYDGPPTVSGPADLPPREARFTFLAACTTAGCGRLVRDEWISLAAALTHAGFRAVTGALRPAPDGPAARIARTVHDHVLAPPPADRPRSWFRRMLDTSRAPSRWRVRRRPGGLTELHHLRGAGAPHPALLDERALLPDHPSARVSCAHYGV